MLLSVLSRPKTQELGHAAYHDGGELSKLLTFIPKESLPGLLAHHFVQQLVPTQGSIFVQSRRKSDQLRLKGCQGVRLGGGRRIGVRSEDKGESEWEVGGGGEEGLLNSGCCR